MSLRRYIAEVRMSRQPYFVRAADTLAGPTGTNSSPLPPAGSVARRYGARLWGIRGEVHRYRKGRRPPGSEAGKPSLAISFAL